MQTTKLLKVYDWNPNTRELLVTFEVDELAFIDAGIPSTEDAIVQFDAGVAASANSNYQPHTLLIEETGSTISLLNCAYHNIQDKVLLKMMMKMMVQVMVLLIW